MATTITIDPVTRIEGHLKLEVTADYVGGGSRLSTRAPPHAVPRIRNDSHGARSVRRAGHHRAHLRRLSTPTTRRPSAAIDAP